MTISCTRGVLNYSGKQLSSSNPIDKIGGVAYAAIAILPALALDLLFPIDPILIDPYNGRPPHKMNVKKFFTDSLAAAFRFLDPPTQASYKQLIENGGMSEEGDPPICIYHWISGCLLVHGFRTQLYVHGIQRLRRPYKKLGCKDQADVLLSVLIPERKILLNRRAKDLVDRIQAQAVKMNQNPAYKKIYTPATTKFLKSLNLSH